MKRHVYQPPKGRLTDMMAALGGIMAAVALFVIIPLTQKIADITEDDTVTDPGLTIEPPKIEDFDPNPPPPDRKDDDRAPDELIDPMDKMELGFDPGDLDFGPGGVCVLDIPNFGLKGGEDPFTGDMDSPPIPVNRTSPQYPSALLKKGIGGKVIVTCVIDAKGNMTSAKVETSSGQALLDKAALDAVRRRKFKPAMRGGKPFQATCHFPFTFRANK